MGELAECGADILETERRVMEHIATKMSDDRGLMYVSWVSEHLKVSFKQVQLREDTCTANTMYSGEAQGLGDFVPFKKMMPSLPLASGM